MTLLAYPGSKSEWGYFVCCFRCKEEYSNVVFMEHVDFLHPITDPPTLGITQMCEGCCRMGELVNPNE
jgi:hypothetical protein